MSVYYHASHLTHESNNLLAVLARFLKTYFTKIKEEDKDITQMKGHGF